MMNMHTFFFTGRVAMEIAVIEKAPGDVKAVIVVP